MTLRTKTSAMTGDTESMRQGDGVGARGGHGGILLAGLAVVACPLLCLAPLLVAGLAATGVARVLQGFPAPLLVGAVLVVLALGIVGAERRRTCPTSTRRAPTAVRPASDQPAQ